MFVMKIRRKLASALALALTCSCMVLSAQGAGVDTRNSFAVGGMTHSLAVQDDGTVLAWGSNQALQLGLEAEDLESKKPVAVKGLSAVSVAAGSDFSVALSYDGTVYTWGYATTCAPKAEDITGVVAIAAGQTRILALKNDGTVWQWQVGQTPQQVPGLSRIASISGGTNHYLALTVGGDVYAWGDNSYGQLGDGTTQSRETPIKVPGLSDILDVAAGTNHSLAACYNGTVYAWGGNSYGQLGSGSSEKTANAPEVVKTIHAAVQVAAGNESSLALTKDGTVYAWGYGEYGQLGNGKNANAQNIPVKVSMQNSKAAYIASGMYHNMAVTSDGVLYVWGRNKNYQLGNGKSDNVNTPQRVDTKVSVNGSYSAGSTESVSPWARTEADWLYQTELVPPMLWGDYQKDITRAEFAHLLVGVYEHIKDTTVATTSSKVNKFTDIQGHALGEDMRKAYMLGILSGSSETTFSPDRTITRQEAAKMLCSFVSKMENVDISTKVQNLGFYGDAADIDAWATPYVYYAYESNIMRGTGGSNFSPKALLSREQSLAILSRLVKSYEWAQ